MSLRSSLRASAAGLAIISAFGAWVPLAHAESVVWSTGFVGVLGAACGGQTWQLALTQLQVEYHAEVTNADTGAVIANGATVPAGTRVTYRFIPHKYTDISWFFTGQAWDSPYGSWVVGAGPSGDYKDILCGKGDFSVDPPVKSLTGIPSSCTTAADGVSKTCTLNDGGTINAGFVFASTRAQFHHQQSAFNLPPVMGGQLKQVGIVRGPSFMVPVQTISHAINVIAIPGNPDDNKPTPPNVAPSAGVSGAGVCTVGNPYSITMTSSDPNGDAIRYGIDWNADDGVDEWVPPTGYVPSGTPQSASRTYSAAGTKTVKVLAQDDKGLSSNWVSTSFQCVNPPPPEQCPGGADCEASMGGSGFSAPPVPQGGTLAADLRISVPSLVGRGKTAKVVWSADNVASCLPVTGDNGDSFTHIRAGNSFFSPIGGKTSSGITARTIYTLACVDLNGVTRTKTATVSVQPRFRER